MSEVPPTPPESPDQPQQPAATVPAEAPAGERTIPLDVHVLDEEEARHAARRLRRDKVAQVLDAIRPHPVESVQGDGRTRQHSLLVMVPIRADRMASLEALLDRIANPPAADEDFEINEKIPFLKLTTVHFARILIHRESPSPEAPIPVWDGKPQAKGPKIPPKLLFSTDFDGPLDEHVDELIRVAGAGLDELFSHCEGWPGIRERGDVHGFFLRHQVKSNTFYTGTMNRSVDQIRREAELRDRVQAFLDEETKKADFPKDPVAIRDRIRAFVAAQPELAWTDHVPGGSPKPIFPQFVLERLTLFAAAAALVVLAALAWVLTMFLPTAWAIGIVVGVVAVLGIAFVAAWDFLRRLEDTDPVIIDPNVKAHTAKLVKTEDRIVQNEMSSVIYIKEPLWFRGTVLRAVLAFIDVSARYLSNTGSLAGIPSIHFARWVIVDGGRRLVFFSNFDGRWENYLGDFIDKSSQGLTGVWSNCVGFPRTQGLVKEGATDEQKFKAYSRQSQIPTQVWYSAYKWLSVSNINNNSKIRLGLYGDMSKAQAEAWLRRFADGGERAAKPTIDDKLAEDRKAAASAPPHPEVEVEDVQGLVARSYRALEHAAYVPAQFGDAAGARAWVGALAAAGVTHVGHRTGDVQEKGHARNLAFTSGGLKAMGLGDDALRTFSREFQEGMAEEHRSRALGDVGPTCPETWRWGGPKNTPVHAMLFLFADSAASLASLLEEERRRADANGVKLGQPLDSVTLKDDKEHFGFHDGIAQPRIAGITKAGSGEIPAGEVVLGYPNAYGKIPLSPTVADAGPAREHLPLQPMDPDAEPGCVPRRDLGKNGTYVVFRQLEQDVRAFWAFADERAGHDAEARKRLASKMVGRWPNGAPLTRHPDAEPPVFNAAKGNSFYYTSEKFPDRHGERCPVASHIRRTNPRDGMMPNPRGSLLVADRHRLLRRGRAYGPPLAESFDPGDILAAPEERAREERGLHFICFNSDLVRQFEFVQNTWVNSMKFDGLYSESDPVIAPHSDPATEPHPENVAGFVEPRCPVRHRETKMERFVTMRGGAYLFMPGLKALKFLAEMK